MRGAGWRAAFAVPAAGHASAPLAGAVPRTPRRAPLLPHTLPRSSPLQPALWGGGEPFWASWSPVSGADGNPGTACPLFHVAPGPGPGVSPGQVDPQLLPDPASGSCLRPGWPAPPHAARQTLARVGRGRSWPRTARRPLLPRPAASRPPSLPPSSARPAPEPAELRVAGTGCDPCPGGRSPVLAAESDRI